MKEMRTRVSVWDITLGIALVLLAVVILIPSSRSVPSEVLIKTADESLTYSLSDDRIISIESNGHTLSVEIRDGTVRVSDSSCPDGICKSSGFIRAHSDVIVCAPAKVLIKLQGTGGDSDADAIAGK